MGNIIALICIFIILPMLVSTLESKNKRVQWIGKAFFGLVAGVIGSILGIVLIIGIPILILGGLVWLLPGADIWEDILAPILGLIFWVFIFVAFTVIRAWWEERKEKRTNKINE